MQPPAAPVDVDARGRLCPEPVLLARAALGRIAAGQSINLRATDPHAELDVEVFCARAGHVLEHVERQQGMWTFRIRKS